MTLPWAADAVIEELVKPPALGLQSVERVTRGLIRAAGSLASFSLLSRTATEVRQRRLLLLPETGSRSSPQCC